MDDEVRYVDNVLSTTRPGVGVNIIYLLLEGVLFFILTLLIEVSQHKDERYQHTCIQSHNRMCCVTSFPQYKFFFPDLHRFFLKDNNGIAEIEQGPTTLLGEVHLHVYLP